MKYSNYKVVYDKYHNRGWYIYIRDSDRYLNKDGLSNDSVDNDTFFWPSESAAHEFLKEQVSDNTKISKEEIEAIQYCLDNGDWIIFPPQREVALKAMTKIKKYLGVENV